METYVVRHEKRQQERSAVEHLDPRQPSQEHYLALSQTKRHVVHLFDEARHEVTTSLPVKALMGCIDKGFLLMAAYTRILKDMTTKDVRYTVDD